MARATSRAKTPNGIADVISFWLRYHEKSEHITRLDDGSYLRKRIMYTSRSVIVNCIVATPLWQWQEEDVRWR